MAVDGSLNFDTKIDTVGFTKGTNTIKKQANGLKSTFASLGKVMIAAFTIKKAIDIGKQSMEIASDLQEVQNVVDTAFGNMAYKMEEFAAVSIESFGISKLAAKQTGSILMAMGVGMGVASENASNMAVSLTGLSADMASFYNVSQDIASTALKSIYTGETETLKQFGVVMTEANLQAFAMSEGISKTVSNMTQAEKVQLRYNFVMKQTALAQGDFAKTSDSWANQTRVLSEKWKEFLGIIGFGLIQVLTPVVKYMSSALSYMTSMATTASSILNAVFGLNTKISTSATSIGNSAEGASAGYEALGNSAEEAGKKANGATAPFDKLNQVASDASSIGGTTIDTPVIDAGIADATSKSSNAISKSFEELRDAIKPTLESLKRFKEALEPVGKFVFDNLKSFYSDVLKPIGKWILGEGLPRLLDVGSDLLEKINWEGLSEAISKFNKAIAPFAIAVGTGFIYFIEALAEILTPIVVGAVDLLAKGLTILASAIKKIPEEVAIAIGGAIGGLVTAILLFNGASAVIGIIKSIGTALGTMLTILAAHPLLAVAAAIAGIAGAVLALNKAKFEKSNLGQYLTELDKVIKSSDELNDEISDYITNADEHRKDIENEYGAIEILADKYFALADEQNRTNGENELLKSYAGDLIELVPELSGLINLQTGEYNGTRDAIDGVIKKSKELALVQAAQDSLVQTGKLLYAANKKLDDLELKRIGTNSQLRTAQEALEKAYYATNGSMEEYQAYLDKGGESVVVLEERVKELKKAKKLEEDQTRDAKIEQQKLNKEWDYASDYITEYSTTLQTEMPKAKAEVDSALKDIANAVKTFKLPTMEVKIGVNTAALEAFGKGTNYSYPGYASGTVVPANFGNYMAVLGDNKREPEVVSPLSTMEKAMENVLNRRGTGGGGGDIKLTLNLDGKTIYESVVKRNEENISKTGKSAFAY